MSMVDSLLSLYLVPVAELGNTGAAFLHNVYGALIVSTRSKADPKGISQGSERLHQSPPPCWASGPPLTRISALFSLQLTLLHYHFESPSKLFRAPSVTAMPPRRRSRTVLPTCEATQRTLQVYPSGGEYSRSCSFDLHLT